MSFYVLSIFLSIYLSAIYLSISIYLSLSCYLSIYLYNISSIYKYLTIYLSLYICISIYLSLSICLFICLSIYILACLDRFALDHSHINFHPFWFFFSRWHTLFLLCKICFSPCFRISQAQSDEMWRAFWRGLIPQKSKWSFYYWFIWLGSPKALNFEVCVVESYIHNNAYLISLNDLLSPNRNSYSTPSSLSKPASEVI